MIEEEALAEQQRMFGEARAQMNGTAVTLKQPEPFMFSTLAKI